VRIGRFVHACMYANISGRAYQRPNDSAMTDASWGDRDVLSAGFLAFGCQGYNALVVKRVASVNHPSITQARIGVLGFRLGNKSRDGAWQ
jgi:hypothetical protein